MNIYLVRHGKQNSTDCNVNVPLCKIGKKQAELLGRRLAKYPIDGLYSSDLIRAIETAKITYNKMQEVSANGFELEHQIREGIKEIDFGDLTGKPDATIKEFYQNYYSTHSPLECDIHYPGGETANQVADRMMPVLDEIIESGKKNVLVVTHGGAIRSLLARLFSGNADKKLLFANSLENCSITQLYYNEENKVFYLERFNDYAHIEADETLLRKNRED